VSGSSATIFNPSGEDGNMKANGGKIDVTATIEGLECAGVYKVTEGSVLGASSDPTWPTASEAVAVRESVNAACEAPGDCDYECTKKYTVESTATTMVLTPDVVSGCTCFILTASVSGSSATITIPTFVTPTFFIGNINANGGKIDVTTTIEGLKCAGVYKVTEGSVLGVSSASTNAALGVAVTMLLAALAC